MNRSRSFIECRGPDSKTLLQGLITNDMGFLEKHVHKAPNQPLSSLAMPHSCSVIYSFFLNTNGRVLYDAFFYNLSSAHTEEHGNYLIECDSLIADQLMKHIKFYKLRKRVDIANVSDRIAVGVLYRTDSLTEPTPLNTAIPIPAEHVLLSAHDPRVRSLCLRVLLLQPPSRPSPSASSSLSQFVDKFGESASTSSEEYTRRRYSLGVAEGAADLPQGQPFPLECNASFLNAVSFSKGCYLGQELTARTHHTGIVRKRLVPLCLTHSLHPSASVQVGDQVYAGSRARSAGTVRGVCGDSALALLRIDDVLAGGASEGHVEIRRPPIPPISSSNSAVKLEGAEIAIARGIARVPHWWPPTALNSKPNT